ncbi:hypothetical protein GCM10027047_39470 [Rhodococcus aerolatus]
MEHRETEEMHEAVDQMLRAALMAVGTARQRATRRQQIAADRARVAAAGTRAELDTYVAAQETMLNQALRRATDPTFFDTTSPAERVATRDMADRYADASPYAATVRDHLDGEAARRGETLTPPDAGPEVAAGHDPTRPAVSAKSTQGRRQDRRQDRLERRRPVAVDTAATEADVADRLEATRSFPRALWSQIKNSRGSKLPADSPTTLPRTRNQDQGLEM